jgi:site-specific DNA-cytosine methylase
MACSHGKKPRRRSPAARAWTTARSRSLIAADGTWHRPLTTLELAALQGFPIELDGRPLVLSGSSQSAWRERIGNAVPPPTAQAIAEQMLISLLQADLEMFALSASGDVWVAPERTASA